jgi:hypothetical protein
MRASKKRDLNLLLARQRIAKQDALTESKDRRKRLRLPVIRTGRPTTMNLTSQKIDEILFG